MLYIGVDPGVSGGIAAIEGDHIRFVGEMPATDRDLLEVLESLGDTGPAFAVLERVHSMPKQGHSGAFTFGRNYGALQMALTAAKIPYDLVTPQKWQLVMGCRTKGDKNVSKRRAQQLFPGFTATHATADALLLAEYGRRTRSGFDGKEKGRQKRQQHQTLQQAEGKASIQRRLDEAQRIRRD